MDLNRSADGLVPRVHVGMMLPGQPAVRLPDVFLVGVARYAQYVVVVSHCGACLHGMMLTPSYNRMAIWSIN